VLAVGGGAFTTDDNIALINTIADSVWLDCPLPVCLERCAHTPGVRPLFSDPEEAAALYNHRKRFYKRARYNVDSGSGTPEIVAQRIIELLGLEPKS
jgi:shikimate kinase